ncbi:MAG: hypothetical protein JWM53_5990 [bacterium]|nr:hypothetical protein [bacterium]
MKPQPHPHSQTPMERAAQLKRVIETQQEIDRLERRLAEIEAEERAEAAATPTPPAGAGRPYVSALGLGYHAQTFPRTPMLPAPSVVAHVPQRARVIVPATPTAADFPRVMNALPLRAGPSPTPTNEELQKLTTAEAVRSGEYAKHRDQLLALGGQQARGTGHAFSSTGLYALGPQQELPPQAHPMAQRRAPQSSTFVQPHGNPVTGPMSPLLVAKLQRAGKRLG